MKKLLLILSLGVFPILSEAQVWMNSYYYISNKGNDINDEAVIYIDSCQKIKNEPQIKNNILLIEYNGWTYYITIWATSNKYERRHWRGRKWTYYYFAIFYDKAYLIKRTDYESNMFGRDKFILWITPYNINNNIKARGWAFTNDERVAKDSFINCDCKK